MAETLSVFRHENKYIVTPVEQLQLQKKLDALLERDDFSKEGTYRVRSLYFDSLNNIDFSTKLAGTEIRKKIRLRVYSPDADRVKLEVKQKNGDLQHKVSLWISRADATALMQMDYSVLLDYAE